MEKFEFLKDKLIEEYGIEKTEEIYKGFYVKRKTTFRVNTLKSSVNEIILELHKNKIEFEKVSWMDEAFILKNNDEEKLRKLTIYEDGKIYIQSLSSMIPPLILGPKEGEDILDMAAAPRRKNL